MSPMSLLNNFRQWLRESRCNQLLAAGAALVAVGFLAGVGIVVAVSGGGEGEEQVIARTAGPSPSAEAPTRTPRRTVTAAPTATPEPQTAVSTAEGIYIVRSDGHDLRGPIGGSGFGWSPDGSRLAVVTGHCDRTFSTVTTEASSPQQIASFPDLAGFISGFEWAPDSRRLLIGLLESSGVNTVFLADAEGQGEPSQLFQSSYFAWSPDSDKVAYLDGSQLQVRELVGSETITVASDVATGGNTWPPVWSPDGRQIAYPSSTGQLYPDLAVVNVDGSGGLALATGSSPKWTADSQSLTFTMNRSGQNAIAHVPAAGGVQEIGPGFSFDASSDGHTVAIYNNLQDGRTEITVYDVKGGGSSLISKNLNPAGGVLDLSPDGTQVLFEAEGATSAIRELYIADIDGASLPDSINEFA